MRMKPLSRTDSFSTNDITRRTMPHHEEAAMEDMDIMKRRSMRMEGTDTMNMEITDIMMRMTPTIDLKVPPGKDVDVVAGEDAVAVIHGVMKRRRRREEQVAAMKRGEAVVGGGTAAGECPIMDVKVIPVSVRRGSIIRDDDRRTHLRPMAMDRRRERNPRRSP